jgi:phosphate transport system permease protein
MINQDRSEALDPAINRVWAAALTLIILVMVLNIAGRLIARLSKVSK